MKKTELQRKAIDFLGSKRINKLYAVIDGTHMMLDEFEIRYLQTQCALTSDFEKFCKKVIIHNGPTKDYPILHWNKSGRFTEKIISGFFDATGTMYISLLRVERGKSPIKPFNLY